MKPYLRRSVFVLFILILAVVALIPLTAQDVPAGPPGACDAIVEAALDATDALCQGTERNHACYGNVMLEAQAHTDVTDFNFDEVGERASLGTLHSLNLSGLDLAGEIWGVALMQVQANLPDTLPGQNTTFLLFGDLSIEDLSEDYTTTEMTVSTGVNVRLVPSDTASLLGSLAPGDTIRVTGQYTNPDGERWARILYDEHRNSTGWVIGFAVDGDLNTQPQVEATDPHYGPMQAFYFKTGIGQPTCVDAPQDGVLIQTPEGAGLVNFFVNGVEIELGSTAYLQAIPNETLNVNLIEGTAWVTANGVKQRLIPGTVSRIPVDADAWVTGTPRFPQPYDLDVIAPLLPPLDSLPVVIEDVPDPQIIVLPTPVPTLPPSGGGGGGDTPVQPACFYDVNQPGNVTFQFTDPATSVVGRIFRRDVNCNETQAGTMTGAERPTFSSWAGQQWIVRDSSGAQLVGFTLPSGGDHTVDVAVEPVLPPCDFDQTQPANLTFVFDPEAIVGSDSAEIIARDENCNEAVISTLVAGETVTHPSFAGQLWIARSTITGDQLTTYTVPAAGNYTVTIPGTIFGGECAYEEIEAAELSFFNPAGNETMEILLEEADCTQIFQATVEGDDSVTFSTFTTRVWYVKDPAGNTVATFTVPGPGTHIVEIPAQ